MLESILVHLKLMNVKNDTVLVITFEFSADASQ